MENVINIAVCLDDNFVMQTTVLLTSIGCNKGNEKIVVYAISENELSVATKTIMISECDKYEMQIVFCVFPISQRKELQNLKIGASHWSLAAFLKLYLPIIIPENVEKVIYLDGDIIVRHCLMELWRADISQYAMAGVMDANQFSPRIVSSLYYDPYKYYYINAGALLLNLVFLRNIGVTNLFDRCMLEHGSTLEYVDQDVFNNVLFDKKLLVSTKFNAQYGCYIKPELRIDAIEEENIVELLKDPVIVHFSDRLKPWHKFCMHPFKKEFDKYLSMTPFKGYKKSNPKRSDLRKYIVRVVLGYHPAMRKI